MLDREQLRRDVAAHHEQFRVWQVRTEVLQRTAEIALREAHERLNRPPARSRPAPRPPAPLA